MRISRKLVEQAIKHWQFIDEYTQIPKDQKQYEKLVEFADMLISMSRHKKIPRITTLLQLVAKNIAAYEEQHFISDYASPIDALIFLMEQHDLTQDDLPEIGSQPLVSKILSGERQLTREHIEKLSQRFKVSPAIFFKG